MRTLDLNNQEALIRSKKEFLRIYYQNGTKTSELIDFLDKSFSVGHLHYVLTQEAWERDNKYFREKRESRSIQESEAWKSYHSDLSRRFHATYLKDYIEPIFRMAKGERKAVVTKITWSDLRFIINLKNKVEEEMREDEISAWEENSAMIHTPVTKVA